jgi:hypothetical protein
MISFEIRHGEVPMKGTVCAALLALLALSWPADAFEIKVKLKDLDPTKPLRDVGKAIEKGAHDTGKTIEKGAQDTGTAIEKGAHDAGKTAEKAASDTGVAVEEGAHDIGDAGVAIGKFVERQAKGGKETLSDAEQRVREGKFVDAVWHLATDPVKHTEENAALAAQESELLSAVGQVAATAYGGPGGAAAYAAWLTYRMTGDAELALRIGMISGATSAAFGAVGEMPTATTGELAKKAIVAGAIGGLAVAAAGGDDAAVRDAFLLSGGMILVQDGYREMTGTDIDARASEDKPYCMATVGAECSPKPHVYERDESGNIKYDQKGRPVVDMGKVELRRPHVGEWAKEGQAGLTHETGVFMQVVSKIPGMNAMALFHDQWSISWDMNSFTNKATILPAVVFTYIGTGVPVYQKIQSEGEAEVSRP